MRAENATVIVWKEGEPVLWRAGSVSAEPLTQVEVVPDGTVVGLPSDEVRTSLLAVSAEERKHLAKSLPFMMEEQVADDVDDLHFVSAALTDDHHLVAFARHERVAQWIGQLSASAETLKTYSPEALCLPLEADECCAVVEGDEVVLRWSEAQGARVDLALMSVVIDSLEITPSRLVIYGSDRQYVVSHLSEQHQKLVDWRQGGWGALLLLSKTTPLINLRQGKFAPPLPLAKWWATWKSVAIAAGVAIALQFSADLIQLQQLKTYNEELRSTIQQVYRQANPRGAVVDVEKQLDRQIAEYSGEEGVAAFTPRLVEVVSATIAQNGKVTSVNYTGGQLRLNLTAPNFASVEQIRQALERAGLNATLETSSARGEEVRARLRVEVS